MNKSNAFIYKQIEKIKIKVLKRVSFLFLL